MPAFVVSNLLRNYFYLGTLTVAWIAWVVALGGVASLDSAISGFSPQTGIVNSLGTGWWNLWMVFGLLWIMMLLIVATSSSSFHCCLAGYRYTMAMFFTLSLAYLVVDLTNVRSFFNSNAFGGKASSAAGAYFAGFLLLGMVWVLWIVALTVDPNTIIYQLVYQLLASAQTPLVFPGAAPAANGGAPGQGNGSTGAAPSYAAKQPQAGPGSSPETFATPQFSASLNDKTPMGTPGNPSPAMNPIGMGAPVAAAAAAAAPSAVAAAAAGGMRAKALYSYTANPDDPNELTFEKGENFKVLDNKGKWWQVQTQAGKVGIVPSNYVQLVQ